MEAGARGHTRPMPPSQRLNPPRPSPWCPCCFWVFTASDGVRLLICKKPPCIVSFWLFITRGGRLSWPQPYTRQVLGSSLILCVP